ncbi:hypothetical protein MMC17_009490, partial [Xylographa soralifera]|nr:hypothetical protein [Xylographa soralifera]
MASAICFDHQNSGFQAGIINGTVNAEVHHHAPPQRPQTPPNPSAIVPFGRDTDFIERGAILDQIHYKCAVPGSRIALVGLGGVGKSQLAIEYAYRIQERSPETWVFWAHTSNAARFEQSYRAIANYVKISERRNPKADIFQLVHDWLRNERKGKWVLILDNIDDASFLLEARGTEGGNSQPLVSYLPQSRNGSILITTRSRNVAQKLVEQCNIIAVEPMSRADALALFEKKLGKQRESQDIAELAVALEFMPLAIVQAAAYISQRAPRCSVRQYLEDFKKSDRKRASLLNYEGEQLRRDRDAKNSIIITWQISFDHVRKIRPSAADLLSLMSFFDRQGIPEALLRDRAEQGNSEQNQEEHDSDNEQDYDKDNISECSDEFEDDIVALRNFSFISINADGSTFEMHSLVQLATRKWLEVHSQLEHWKQQFVRNLCAEFPTGEYENWIRCQALFPHAKSAAAQRPETQDSLRDWASILYKAAWYAWRVGNAVEAEKMSVQALKVRKRILGREHEDTLNSMAMVGLAYELRGLWEAAEKLQLQ